MSKRSLCLVAILVTSLLSLNFQCGRELPIRPYDQAFEIPVDIYPLKKSYSLTDTIWLETDVSGKILFDKKSNQNVVADTGMISLNVGFNEFGTYITSPSNGFSDVITANGVNNNRLLSNWGTAGTIENYGCGQPGYKIKIGFKPNQKGTYSLSFVQNWHLESCSNKVVPYYATVSYKFKPTDLGLDIFNALSKNDKGGADGINYYTDKINKKELFVFRVE
jgi:hypothetical protein